MTTVATCPGRICLGGEDLDWMGGSTIQAAIDLKVTARVALQGGNGEVALKSAWPVEMERLVKTVDVGARRQDALDYPAAGLACVIDEFGPFRGTVALSSTLPMAAGLGSSAACLVATIAAATGELGHALTRDAICRLAVRAERDWLQTGAGEMDFFACGLGGIRLMRFEAEKQVYAAEFPAARAVIVVGDSRNHATTARSIARKRERFLAQERSIVEYRRRTDALVHEMGAALESARELSAIGTYVTDCHGAISRLMGSSTSQIDEMVAAALQAGASGAKLTGGGEGGCMFAIVDQFPSRASDVAVAVEAAGATAYQTFVSTNGMLIVAA